MKSFGAEAKLSVRNTLPANDKVGIVKLLEPNALSTCFAAVSSYIFVLRMWSEIQTGLPLFILVRLITLHEAVHADTHHVPLACALTQRHTTNDHYTT